MLWNIARCGAPLVGLNPFSEFMTVPDNDFQFAGNASQNPAKFQKLFSPWCLAWFVGQKHLCRSFPFALIGTFVSEYRV